MKKIFILVAAFCAMNMSCTQDFESFENAAPQQEHICDEGADVCSPEEQAHIEAAIVLYDMCLTAWSDDIPAEMLSGEPGYQTMIDVIRYCDFHFEKGDLLCEMNEYETLVEILWPNGFGVM